LSQLQPLQIQELSRQPEAQPVFDQKKLGLGWRMYDSSSDEQSEA
jgi:hypothetical protein